MTLAVPGQILCTAEFAQDIQNENGLQGKLVEVEGLYQIKNETPFRLFNYLSSYGEKAFKIGSKKLPDPRFRVDLKKRSTST
jgi:hypothetical protein